MYILSTKNKKKKKTINYSNYFKKINNQENQFLKSKRFLFQNDFLIFKFDNLIIDLNQDSILHPLLPLKKKFIYTKDKTYKGTLEISIFFDKEFYFLNLFKIKKILIQKYKQSSSLPGFICGKPPKYKKKVIYLYSCGLLFKMEKKELIKNKRFIYRYTKYKKFLRKIVFKPLIFQIKGFKKKKIIFSRKKYVKNLKYK